MSFPYLRNASLLALFSLVACAPAMASQATYRVVAYSPYSEPGGITEAAPGLFYSSADGYYIFSVTEQGSLVTIASFPTTDEISSLIMSAANGLLYSAVTVSGEGTGTNGTVNVFS